MPDTLLMGAVAYDPKVVTIWDGFKQHFAEHGLDFDYILYSNYERQVEQHFDGAYHVAWNSPLAWLEAERTAERLGRRAHAIAMRNTDCDLRSVIVVRTDSGIKTLADLAGKRVGFGAHDSPQATLIPLLHIEKAGLERGKDFEMKLFDVLVGKHGDHVGGERDAAKALMDGDVDAACMIDGNHLWFSKEGTLPAGATTVLSETEAYDHCNFTVLDGAPTDLVERFRKLLLDMRYDDPKVRPLLDLEGLKVWKEGRTRGYASLAEAVDRFGTIDAFVDALSQRHRG
jgi:phosphonate transport system substrate-binding protein